MFGLGPTELIIILVIILIIFGPSRLPQIGKSIGSGLSEFKSAVTDVKKTVTIDIDGEKIDEEEDEKRE